MGTGKPGTRKKPVATSLLSAEDAGEGDFAGRRFGGGGVALIAQGEAAVEGAGGSGEAQWEHRWKIVRARNMCCLRRRVGNSAIRLRFFGDLMCIAFCGVRRARCPTGGQEIAPIVGAGIGSDACGVGCGFLGHFR